MRVRVLLWGGASRTYHASAFYRGMERRIIHEALFCEVLIHDLRVVLASGGRARVLPWRPAGVAAVAGSCG